MCLENKSEMLDKMGIELLALGNISNVIGTYFNIKEQLKENDYLIIIGNSLQSIGAFRSRSGFASDENGTENNNTRQFSAKFRAELQAYQGIINVMKNRIENEDSLVDQKDERIIALIGVWIQAIGTVISAIGLTIIEKEERLEK